MSLTSLLRSGDLHNYQPLVWLPRGCEVYLKSLTMSLPNARVDSCGANQTKGPREERSEDDDYRFVITTGGSANCIYG